MKVEECLERPFLSNFGLLVHVRVDLGGEITSNDKRFSVILIIILLMNTQTCYIAAAGSPLTPSAVAKLAPTDVLLDNGPYQPGT